MELLFIISRDGEIKSRRPDNNPLNNKFSMNRFVEQVWVDCPHLVPTGLPFQWFKCIAEEAIFVTHYLHCTLKPLQTEYKLEGNQGKWIRAVPLYRLAGDNYILITKRSLRRNRGD